MMDAIRFLYIILLCSAKLNIRLDPRKGDISQDRYSTIKINAGSVIPVNVMDIGVLEYYGLITLGDNASQYSFKFDTGFTSMCITSSTCNGCQHNRYVCKGVYCKSTQTVVSFNYSYGNATGNITTDLFQFGSTNFSSTFISITNQSGKLNLNSDGICGLSFDSVYSPNNIITTLISQQIISEAVVGLYLNHTSISQITFGGYDEDLAKNIEWLPLINQTVWQVSLQSVAIGDIKYSKAKSAILDTGISHLIVPRNVFIQYIFLLSSHYSLCDVYYPLGLYGCILGAKQDLTGFKDVSFIFADKNYTISVKDMVYLIHDKDSGYYIGCVLMEPWDNDLWVVGANFFQDRYVVLDYQNARLGISNME